MRAKPFNPQAVKSRQTLSVSLLTDEQRQKVDADQERSWRETLKGRRPPTVSAMAANLEKLQHLAPGKLAALDILIESALREEKAEMASARGIRGQILSRLQQQHECRLPLGGGFEQIEPLGKVRQWRCLGCQRIVTLDDKGGDR